ncbi:multivesicular body subunit 12A isoform X1 [Tachysurus fulvidraco]|uniref:multivesicular body subunit 12A isoform X1 n=1 Tax=Tachysurus fulvidraco TaxID=1234273 RepID=UPI001FED3E8F|nr:multivesicular body subunit 12A isoform X1 [Tachysurus fulvidraco]XP_047659197.1 multivesicular body subunit 12A isoform X1 [Tachysurus fulvidraco]
MSSSSVQNRPISAIAWTSNNSTCPPHFTMIATTEDGAAANFTRGFGLKSGYFLCYSKDLSGGMMVSDVQVISDKDVIPHGYCYIPEFMESKSSVWKKKRVCVRIVPVDSLATAVLDIRVTVKSKMMLPQYTCLGDILGYVLWCLKGTFSSPVPQVKPRSLSIDMRQLSLEPAAPLPLRPNNQTSQGQPKVSRRRSNLDRTETDRTEKVHDGSSIYGITAMDGVPFALHPKFENRVIEKVSISALDNIRIKSLQDIENEYNYTFAVEEAARIPRS